MWTCTKRGKGEGGSGTKSHTGRMNRLAKVMTNASDPSFKFMPWVPLGGKDPEVILCPL